ncbi:MAG TPA: class I SAM-dependent methyltransferase [Chitinophagaceae bacterium]|jgi:2-polyprenyl-3-methyl-5-hydroxy-6-metoxy-1,4-benzoquinol methylase|nr:MAG: Ubiquinone biosynthesis O-methyltransferase [Bacteroidetes bacterium ADurb.Bin008]HNK61348.1 class I SAM-dependent methyltransferase [Chitinophagaceae bacterium]
MNVEEAYKHWSAQYDTNQNKTRDLEAISLRETLNDIKFENCLEIGCGTGKNTEWLLTKGQKITAIDLSEEMLTIAREKISNDNVQLLKVDINQDWTFTTEKFDLVVCSLVLEHIENINRIFKLISEHLTKNGTVYIGELHPFKQYSGSKASFENEEGKQTVTVFTHHISEFTSLAKQNGLTISEVKEYFDDGNTTSIPRILTLKFTK